MSWRCLWVCLPVANRPKPTGSFMVVWMFLAAIPNISLLEVSDVYRPWQVGCRMHNCQAVCDNTTLTHNFSIIQSRMVRTWSMTANFPDFFFFAPFPTQDQPEKAKYIPQSNHIRSPASSCPASSFFIPKTCNLANLQPSLSLTVKFSHSSPCLWVSA